MTGFAGPLYVLPFDHRDSYTKGIFHIGPHPVGAEAQKVADSKRIIYNGFLAALDDGVPRAAAAILVDEQFGAEVLADARAKGLMFAVSVEKSGQEEFEFQYGEQFEQHIEKIDPTFAKVLVRFNPDGDAALNARQIALLRTLSEYCTRTDRAFMFELLVPATAVQLASADQDKSVYDLRLRPELMVRAVTTLQDAGVEPSVWKLEGLDQAVDYKVLVDTIQRGGRQDIGCIVLGRGADEDTVSHWLSTAASVPGMTGFAVGRTVFWDAIAAYEAGTLSAEQAARDIADRFHHWVKLFEESHP